MTQFNTPLISIIIPCYKAEKELPDALRSISSQNYTQWEVIAVNDAWQDQTSQIIQHFSISHPGHRVIYENHPQNRGLGATRNTGMELARGELIAFLDHDDIWTPDHLQRGVELLMRESADIYYSTVQIFDFVTRNPAGLWGPTAEDLKQFADNLFLRNFITPSSVIFRKSIIAQVGLMAEFRGCEDHDYWLRFIEKGARFITSPVITTWYRSGNPTSLSAKSEVMLKSDIQVQKFHWNSPCFSESGKRNALANNYRLLSNHFKRHGSYMKYFFYFLFSFYWHTDKLGYLFTRLRSFLSKIHKACLMSNR